MQEACDEKPVCLLWRPADAGHGTTKGLFISTNTRHWPRSWGCGGNRDRQAFIEECEELTILSYVFNGWSRCSVRGKAGIETIAITQT